MKTLTVVVLATGVIIGGYLFLENQATPLVYQLERTATTTEEYIEEVDVLDAAKAELERISQELDAEEARLLEERKEIDARLEAVRATRAGF